jgi:hypothetical protein
MFRVETQTERSMAASGGDCNGFLLRGVWCEGWFEVWWSVEADA